MDDHRPTRAVLYSINQNGVVARIVEVIEYYIERSLLNMAVVRYANGVTTSVPLAMVKIGYFNA